MGICLVGSLMDASLTSAAMRLLPSTYVAQATGKQGVTQQVSLCEELAKNAAT